MKAIILISSIFYILGLKIGNKIDLVKKNIPVDKIISNNIKVKKPSDCCVFNNEIVQKSDCDTVKRGISYSNALLKEVQL